MGTKISGQASTVAAATTAPLPLTAPATRLDVPLALAAKPIVAANPPAVQPHASTPQAEAPKEKVTVPAPAKDQATEEARIPKPAAVKGTELVVQVAALVQEDDARKLAETLRQQNFKASVSTLPVDSLFRVTLGPYTDAATARNLVAKLKKAGFAAFIRREPVSESLGT
jgi:cell division septation protein DedD